MNLDENMFPYAEYTDVQHQTSTQQNDAWMYNHICSGSAPVPRNVEDTNANNGCRLFYPTVRLLLGATTSVPATSTATTLFDFDKFLTRFIPQEL